MAALAAVILARRELTDDVSGARLTVVLIVLPSSKRSTPPTTTSPSALIAPWVVIPAVLSIVPVTVKLSAISRFDAVPQTSISSVLLIVPPVISTLGMAPRLLTAASA